MNMPAIPAGNGQHFVSLVVISANDLAASSAFYASIFGWQMMKMSNELTAVGAPAGPMAALRANVPAGFPGVVPYLAARDVADMLARVVAAGGTVERAPWTIPMMGTLARFTDTSGTVYGLTDAVSPAGAPLIPMPFGDNPKPPAGTICSLEMFTVDAAGTSLFADAFGWGMVPTMPQFVGFNPGAGIGGVFQSHTPAMPAVAYVYVNDVAATLTAIDAAGGKRLGEPMGMPGMATFGYFTDPSGTNMGLIGG
jgi:uncharacterized protein